MLHLVRARVMIMVRVRFRFRVRVGIRLRIRVRVMMMAGDSWAQSNNSSRFLFSYGSQLGCRIGDFCPQRIFVPNGRCILGLESGLECG